MTKYRNILVTIIGLILLGYISFSMLRGDTVNEVYRKQVEYLDGSYRGIQSNNTVVKSWIIKSGKVTSTEKGYYYFWTKGKYVQVPMGYTIIEQI